MQLLLIYKPLLYYLFCSALKMALLVLAVNGIHTVFIYVTLMISLISAMNNFVTCLNRMCIFRICQSASKCRFRAVLMETQIIHSRITAIEILLHQIWVNVCFFLNTASPTKHIIYIILVRIAIGAVNQH
jgi:hypothetical protein